MTVGQVAADHVAVGPALDVRNVSSVRAELHAALEAGAGDLIVDMGEVEGIDAAGLGMLTAAHLRAERVGRRLVLRGCSDDLRRVFAVTRLSRILNIDRSDRTTRSLELSA
jgi:anti-sigma B factor antagonist